MDRKGKGRKSASTRKETGRIINRLAVAYQMGEALSRYQTSNGGNPIMSKKTSSCATAYEDPAIKPTKPSTKKGSYGKKKRNHGGGVRKTAKSGHGRGIQNSAIKKQ